MKLGQVRRFFRRMLRQPIEPIELASPLMQEVTRLVVAIAQIMIIEGYESAMDEGQRLALAEHLAGVPAGSFSWPEEYPIWPVQE